MNTYIIKIRDHTEYTIENVANMQVAIDMCIKNHQIKIDDIIEVKCTTYRVELPEEELEKLISSYQYKGGGRRLTDEEIKWNDMPIEEHVCPVCGKKYLFQGSYGSWDIQYRVECDACGFMCPIQLSDCGEQLVLAKEWLFVFDKMGKPMSKIKDDVTLYLYKKGKARDKEYEWRKREDWYF